MLMRILQCHLPRLPQVDQLIQMVADEHGLELGTQLDEAGRVGTSVPQAQPAAADGVDALSQRLADLRK